jgi:hypothetical protein
MVVAAFRELTDEGHTRLQTLAYVGIPVAILVLVWSFITEARAARKARELEAEAEEAGAAGVGSYPIPSLAGMAALDVTATRSATQPAPEVLDG